MLFYLIDNFAHFSLPASGVILPVEKLLEYEEEAKSGSGK